MLRSLLISLALSFMCCFNVFADTATPSNADPADTVMGETTVDQVVSSGGGSSSGSFSEDPDQELADMLFDLIASLGGPGVATASNADMETDDPDSPVLGQVNIFNPPALLSLESEEDFVNVLRFDVSVDGTDYTLLFSPSYIDQLYVDENGSLWNMGTSQVQGLVVDGSFNPYNTTGTLVYLAPCLGNNFSNNYNYGSPNWFREYYWSTSSGYDRLNYDDTYVQITVTKSYFPFFAGDTLMYLLIFLVGGGVIICWLNRFRRY